MPAIIKNGFFFQSARIILDDDRLCSEIKLKKYPYITGLSYKFFNFGKEVKVKHKKTILVPCNVESEQWLLDCNANTRNEIRSTFDNKDLVFVCDDKNYEVIYKLYEDFERAQGRKPLGKYIFQGCKVFSAYYQGKCISSIICYDARPILRSRANFSIRLFSDDKKVQRLVSRGTRRIIYEICAFGRERGYDFFDQGSINLQDPKKKSIADFKAGFGGRLVDEYSYIYMSQFFYYAYSFFHKGR